MSIRLISSEHCETTQVYNPTHSPPTESSVTPETDVTGQSHVGRIVHEHSAGGVVIRGRGAGGEVLLIKPAGRDRWQLPKGLIDAGEHAAAAAIREVREEDGVHASVVAPLEPIRFFYQMHGKRIRKRVDFFVMSFDSGSEANHDEEVSEARWVPLREAVDMLTFRSEQDTVSSAIHYLDQAAARSDRSWP
jgi:8-oxo-dGTP pyrophosphatase MutT (NUDIX family)